MPGEFQSVEKFRLSAGERLLWSGAPKQGILFHGWDFYVIPFGLFWTGATVLGGVAAAVEGSPAALLFFLPFWLVGAYMLVGRFWLDARLRRRTSYAVTSQSIVIVSGLFGLNIKSLGLRTLSDVTLTEKADGSGTITLGPSNWMTSMYSGAWGWELTPQLILSERAHDVYEIIRKAQIAELGLHRGGEP